MMTVGIINKAKTEAKKSTHRFKVGAVIFNKKRIISSGHNYARKSVRSLLPSFQKRKNSVHAEVDSIIKAKTDLKGMSMLVVRVNTSGNLGLAKPCDHCMTYIRHVELKDVYYSSTDNKIERIKL